MNLALYHQWLIRQFPFSIPYPAFPFFAFTTPLRCVIGARLSELNFVRCALDADPLLPRPFTVFLAKDQDAIPDPPADARWYLATPDALIRYERDVPQTGPLHLPDRVPAPTDGTSSCTTCSFSVNPCPYHVFGYARTAIDCSK